MTAQQIQNWFNHKKSHARRQRNVSNSRFSPKTRLILNEAFNNNQNPDKDMIEQVSRLTELSERQIKCWFRKQKYILKRQQ